MEWISAFRFVFIVFSLQKDKQEDVYERWDNCGEDIVDVMRSDIVHNIHKGYTECVSR
jgi:hypothetical protein